MKHFEIGSDLYNFLLRDHHRRTAIIACHLGNAHEISRNSIQKLLLSASLHDIGAMHVQERDKLFELDVENPDPHEQLGAAILKGFTHFDTISSIVRHHHIIYRDVLEGKIPQEEVAPECYILHLADRIDVLYALSGDDQKMVPELLENITERMGTTFDPSLEKPMREVTAKGSFWNSINQASFHELLINNLSDEFITISRGDIRDLSLVFSRIVDCKSPWTLHHSRTVSRLARFIGELLGYAEEKCFNLEITGLLHDIGKVGIPSELLEKNGPLDSDEREQIKLHALYSSLILGAIEGFDDIALWASSHHEKRDKTGYPLHISRTEFRKEIDIIAFADIFTALGENRPYRQGYKLEKIMAILADLVPDKLDSSIFSVIEEHAEELFILQQEMQSEHFLPSI